MLPSRQHSQLSQSPGTAGQGEGRNYDNNDIFGLTLLAIYNVSSRLPAELWLVKY